MENLSEPERLLREAFARGAWVDLRTGRAGIDDPETGSRWPASRLIRAEVIRAMVLSRPEAGHDGVAAVRLAGAQIPGLLELVHADVSFPVYLRGCWLEKAPDLRWSSIRHLDLSDSHFPALNAESAHIEGDLVVSACVAKAVTLRRARIDGDLTMRGARLSGESGVSIDATTCSVAGNMTMEGITADGEVRLADATVSGAINLNEGRLRNPGGIALDGIRITVGGRMSCGNGFSSQGDMDFHSAHITGTLNFYRARIEGCLGAVDARIENNLELSAAQLINPGCVALQGSRLTVNGQVFCRDGFSCEGEMVLRRAHIGGFVSFVGARLSNPGGTALFAPHITADGGIAWPDNESVVNGQVNFSEARISDGLYLASAVLDPAADTLQCSFLVTPELVLPQKPTAGLVDLRHADVGRLHADPQSTPAGIRADGLTYELLMPLLPARTRIKWLTCGEDSYAPQPYEQLAAAYRQIGHDADARIVLHAKQRRRHRNLPLLSRLWGFLQDVTTGYGYRPGRAGLWLIALVALGTLVFGIHPPAPLKNSVSPQFNPFFYTVDLLIPIVTYGQQAAYGPPGPYQWLAYGLMTAGWLLATTVLAGITRALSRN
jgi:hypothetical protein